MDIDDTDRAILRALQADARKPFSEIAREIDMSSATVHDRVSQLGGAGVIRGYHADVNPRAVGFGTSAIVGLRVEQGREDEALDRLSDIDGVQEVNLTTGEWDIILRVVAEDTDDLRDIMFERIADMDGFARSQTMVVLGTEYESAELPL
jgi:Lrp/AsnC family transcriptional regulator for asnA, asnC and gidA